MDEIMNDAVVDEKVKSVEEDVVKEQESAEDPLKDAIDAQLRKIQRQNILIGAQTVCAVVLEKIMTAMNKPGKRTMNDYKRLVKDVENFCRTGVSRKINADGEVELVQEEPNTEETVQN